MITIPGVIREESVDTVGAQKKSKNRLKNRQSEEDYGKVRRES